MDEANLAKEGRRPSPDLSRKRERGRRFKSLLPFTGEGWMRVFFFFFFFFFFSLPRKQQNEIDRVSRLRSAGGLPIL
jgi:hypothetical protein